MGDELFLPATEAHHAAHVLRLRAGDAVELFDGAGRSALARIASTRHGEVGAVIDEVRPREARPLPVVHLAFAVPKGNRLDWLLEKATELGAASLRPVLFERSVAGGDELSAAKRRRWMGHCIAAAKQAGADFLPTLGQPLPLEEFLAEARGTPGFYGETAERAAPMAQVLDIPSRQKGGSGAMALVIGPEGGLTKEETGTLQTAGFVGMRLGQTTLRIETAAVALIAAAVALYDRG